MDDAERTSLKAKIDQLQTVYIVLFGGSLVVLALQWFVIGWGNGGRLLWFVLLGSAVGTRIYRTSLVNRYNADLGGRLQ
jgi:hypothetical protein